MLVKTIAELLSIPAVAFCLLWTATITTSRGVTASPQSAAIDKPANSTDRDENNLLEIGRASGLQVTSQTLKQFKVISYNIRWRGGEDLRELIRLFHQDSELSGAVLMALQEVDRNKKRTKNTNTVKLLAEELGMHYAWAAPPSKQGQEEETGVAILSVSPLSDVRRIVLPHPGPGKRRRVALGATLTLGSTRMRMYSVHAETRIATSKKLEQMGAVIEDLKTFPTEMPAVIMGDLNTWEPGAVKKTFKLFQDSGFTTPFNDDSTFNRNLMVMNLHLKLDWVWLRGLEASSYGIDKEIDVSDHWPLWAVLQSKPASTTAGKPKSGS